MKRIALLIFLFLLCKTIFAQEYWQEKREYANLLSQLREVGFSKKELFYLLSDPRFEFYPDVYDKFKKAGKKSKENPYLKFLTEESIEMGREFLKENKELLDEVEKEYRVEKEFITALLRVESCFGDNLGDHRALCVFASLIHFGKDDHKRIAWAKKELTAFLKMCRKLGKDALAIKSSYAGAVSMIQFMPTSWEPFAVDEDGDGKADIFIQEDALASMANFLIKHGWKKNRHKSIYSYNHSSRFVRTIQTYARKLKE